MSVFNPYTAASRQRIAAASRLQRAYRARLARTTRTQRHRMTAFRIRARRIARAPLAPYLAMARARIGAARLIQGAYRSRLARTTRAQRHRTTALRRLVRRRAGTRTNRVGF